jgi:hypothetical protein
VKAIFPLVALTALLAGCAAPPKPMPAPKPVIVQPRPAPGPVPLPPSPADWRDAAQTPGNWRWAILADQSTAMFGNVRAGGADLMLLACDRQKKRVLLARAGTAPTAVPLAVTTTSMRRPLLSDPALGGGSWLVVPLAAGDPLLDAIAFSRGRFALETAGLETLYLPAWPEISRVIEDCR